MDAGVAELKLNPDETKRVYVDITRDMDMKIRIRCFTMEAKTGRKITRREYLENLIREDIAKVKGASLREITMRKGSKE
jgi:hypothetical protein